MILIPGPLQRAHVVDLILDVRTLKWGLIATRDNRLWFQCLRRFRLIDGRNGSLLAECLTGVLAIRADVLGHCQWRRAALGQATRKEIAMLESKEVVATIAVKDLAVGRKFYEGTLGLKVLHVEGSEAVTFQSGPTRLIVYHSQFAGTNRATAANFMVGGDIASIVKDLSAKGVRFEHYDFPGVTHEGDVHVFGDLKTAWFKDPDGNILSVVNR